MQQTESLSDLTKQIFFLYRNKTTSDEVLIKTSLSMKSTDRLKIQVKKILKFLKILFENKILS